MRSNGARYARFAGALAAVGAAAIGYRPILHSYFWLDDFRVPAEFAEPGDRLATLVVPPDHDHR